MAQRYRAGRNRANSLCGDGFVNPADYALVGRCCGTTMLGGLMFAGVGFTTMLNGAIVGC